MLIEKKILEKWKKLRSAEDTGKLAEKMEGGYPEIFSRAFRYGKCNDEVFKIMAEFYDEKAKLIKEYL
jgi:hypothetical protein